MSTEDVIWPLTGSVVRWTGDDDGAYLSLVLAVPGLPASGTEVVVTPKGWGAVGGLENQDTERRVGRGQERAALLELLMEIDIQLTRDDEVGPLAAINWVRGAIAAREVADRGR